MRTAARRASHGQGTARLPYHPRQPSPHELPTFCDELRTGRRPHKPSKTRLADACPHPLVRPGTAPRRNAPGPSPHPARTGHRLVSLAEGTPGQRTALTPS